MFVHHVYFWLKNPGNIAESKQLLAGLQTLIEIEPKISAHIGVPAETTRDVVDSSYSYSLLMIFDSAQDEDAYELHPIHLKFLDDCGSLWEKVAVYDAVSLL